MTGEHRVAAIPETVENYVNNGARVLVETGAGEGIFFNDSDYQAAGADIAAHAADLYAHSNLILKVKEPKYNEALRRHEAEMIAPGSTLISFLHPANEINHAMVRMLAERNITSFTLDSVPRISRAQRMDALTSMSTVAGYRAVTFAAEKLARFVPLMPTAFGIINPARFLVVGTGVVGLQSVATAKRLGARVTSLDIRPDANEQAKSLGVEVIPFDIPEELAVGSGGYARRLPDEWYAKEREALAHHVSQADAVILTALIPGQIAPILVDQAMVATMKRGSVIVDVAVDQGGNCALSKPGENQLHNGVLISSIANIPSTLAVDATWMFARNIMHFLNYVTRDLQTNDPGVRTDTTDEIIREMLVTTNGQIVHAGTLQAMQEAETGLA